LGGLGYFKDIDLSALSGVHAEEAYRMGRFGYR